MTETPPTPPPPPPPPQQQQQQQQQQDHRPDLRISLLVVYLLHLLYTLYMVMVMRALAHSGLIILRKQLSSIQISFIVIVVKFNGHIYGMFKLH